MRGERQTFIGMAGVWQFCSPVGHGAGAAARQPDRGGQSGRTSGPSTTRAGRDAPEPKPVFEIYGFAMLDIGHDFKQIHPDWFDDAARSPSCRVQRTSSARTAARSPACGRAGSASDVSIDPTELGELKTIFEFELFGTGVDAGQTTFRLRHA